MVCSRHGCAAMLGDFIEVVRRAGADNNARVVILTGVPGVFCDHQEGVAAFLERRQASFTGT